MFFNKIFQRENQLSEKSKLKTLDKFIEVLCLYSVPMHDPDDYGELDFCRNSLSIDVDILLAGIKMYTKLVENLDDLSLNTTNVIFNTYHKLLENFIIFAQRVIINNNEPTVLNEQTFKNVETALVLQKMFMTDKGIAVINNDRMIIKNYERAIKMISTMLINLVINEDHPTSHLKVVMFELFKVIFVSICNPKMFYVIRYQFSETVDKQDGIFFLFDSYFRILTKCISP